jgi:hypothetical protein
VQYEQVQKARVFREKDSITVILVAWHLIGGGLREWKVHFSPKFGVASRDLGQFGGGGYD